MKEPIIFKLDQNYIAIKKEAFIFVQKQLKLLDELNKRLRDIDSIPGPGPEDNSKGDDHD